jgi:hypothetical protein
MVGYGIVRTAFLLSILVFSSLPAGAAIDPLQVETADGSWFLIQAGASARLELPAGKTVSVPLPAGTELRSLAPLAEGWLAAGTTAAAEGSRRLLLLRGDDRSARLIAAPATAGRLSHAPLLLSRDGRLAGLAWLEGEGERRFAVRAARWTGRGWAAAVTVAPPGSGSQLALTGAVLADGSWLLAWSAQDGNDADIWWSRLQAGSWSTPQRVSRDNAVPDITPSLVAAGKGALIAWSRYDGDSYRLHRARFRDDSRDGRQRWQEEAATGSPSTLYPKFLAGSAERPRLLFLNARAGSWELEELDATGRILRKAAAPGDRKTAGERPMVLDESQEVRFRWSLTSPKASPIPEVTSRWERSTEKP